jgi:hypothetical protein
MDYEELLNYAGFDCIPITHRIRYFWYTVKEFYTEYVETGTTNHRSDRQS